MRLFGLDLVDVTLEEATSRVLQHAADGRREIVYFVNAHCVNIAARHREYLRALHAATRLYADGSGMAVAARIAGTRFVDNVNGTDMFPPLCRGAAERGLPLALLGAAPGIAQRVVDNMRRDLPSLQTPFVRDGFFARDEEARVVDEINGSGARILLVAMGVPGQELWIDRNASRLQVPVLMGVGGLFDFFSGHRKRAPLLLRRTGMEWTFRLAQEPGRLFRRYILGNPSFIARSLRLRLRGREALESGGTLFALDDATRG